MHGVKLMGNGDLCDVCGMQLMGKGDDIGVLLLRRQ